MKQGRLIMFVSIMVCVMLFPGCSKRVDHSKSVKFTFMSTPQQFLTIKKIAGLFEQQNKGVTIILDQRPITMYEDKMIVESAAGNTSDIVYLWGQQFWPWSDKNILLDLTPYLKNDKSFEMDGFYPMALDAFKVNGHTYALPVSFGTIAIFYNKTMFEKGNIKINITNIQNIGV